MAKMTEEDVIIKAKELESSRLKKRNPGETQFLKSVRRELRTPKVLNYIFSRPESFTLKNEIQFVPCNESNGDLELFDSDMELIFIKFLLGYPKGLKLIRNELQTVSILVAFEYAKKRYESISEKLWGRDRETIPYFGRSADYSVDLAKAVESMAEELNGENDINILAEYIQLVSKDIDLSPNSKRTHNYTNLDLPTDKKILILVSGCPDSGKTSLAQMLFERFKNANIIDSDYHLDDYSKPLEKQFNGTSVLIISDTDVCYRYSEQNNSDYHIFNVIVRPSSYERMHKYKVKDPMVANKPLEEVITHYEKRYKYDGINGAIEVINNYDEYFYNTPDYVIEQIIKRLGLNPEDFKNNNLQKKIGM